MQKSKIISTYIYCSAGNQLKITRHIIDSLKENAHFPNPIPTLADIEAALNSYAVALSDAGKFDREKVAIKNDKQAILQQVLRDLADYVTQTCKGNRSMLISSGFDVNVEKSQTQRAPSRLQVEIGQAGQVTTKVKRLGRARAYVHQYTADPITPQSVWVSETTVKSTHTFTGLPSSSRIWLRVIVIDSGGGQIVWDPVLRIVQ